MPNFTNVELTDTVLTFGVASGNVIQAQILYREQFPDRVVLNLKTFNSPVQRLRDIRKFHPRTEDRGRDRSQGVVEPKVPPRSPDLNPCDFLWGHLKQLVYSQPINSVQELTGRVVAVVPKFGKIVKFFQRCLDQWLGGHRRVSPSRTTFSAFTVNKIR
jgi:hypothetical protein